MTRSPRYPALCQINTRVYLSEIAGRLNRPATFDDVPDEAIEAWARTGFDLIWWLGVWQTGPAARQVSASNADLLAEYRRVLPDFRLEDVCGSCFAIQAYRVHDDFGGDEALARLRRRMRDRGLRLILDFVPNHTAPDHAWVHDHIDYYVSGTDAQLAAEPQNYCRLSTARGPRILAYGRDPYFAGWSDTLQLNYGSPGFQHAMGDELRHIAERCDGVRCDMAMLVLPEVFERTWGIRADPFWPDVTRSIHEAHPGFLFLAEVYWDLEWTLQQQGFDYTYDKRLYDRLRDREARAVRGHLAAGLDFQDKLARFLENHDEPRAAATFPIDVHRAAAIVTFLGPGLRFFHQGQFDGRTVRIPVHLRRGPVEPVDRAVAEFYERLLCCLKDPVFRDGDWRLLECRPTWDGNASSEAFVACEWTNLPSDRRLVVVNYADHQSQCFVTLPWPDLRGRTWQLRDRMGSAAYARDGNDLATRGLFLDLAPWTFHVFDVQAE